MRQKVALPVRFVSLEESIQTTTRELSVDSAFVRCVDAPGAGTRIVLELQFKAGSVNTFAEVDGVEIDPTDPGFVARFVAPEPLFLERVGEVLARARAAEATKAAAERSTTAGANRRAVNRFPGPLVVKLGGRGLRAGVYAHNISSTGLFVLMPNPPPIGTVLDLELELPDKLAAVGVQARVVRILDAEQALAQRTAPGAGLVFMGGNDEFRTRYGAYLATLPGAKR